METSKCVFLDGRHVIAGRDCPHDESTDEVGNPIPSGWTVQQPTQTKGHPNG